jgi:hypothetical protein
METPFLECLEVEQGHRRRLSSRILHLLTWDERGYLKNLVLPRLRFLAFRGKNRFDHVSLVDFLESRWNPDDPTSCLKEVTVGPLECSTYMEALWRMKRLEDEGLRFGMLY